jgi:hypothetical protein
MLKNEKKIARILMMSRILCMEILDVEKVARE